MIEQHTAQQIRNDSQLECFGMKKLLITLLFALLLIGCTAENDDEQALAMQLLKADEDNGVTLEEEMYQQLTGLVEENPSLGVTDDFSVHAIDLVEKADGESVFLFLGINRLEKPIKNITLEYTLGIETEGSVDYIIEGYEVDLSETFAGVIQPNHAIPFTIPVTPEGKEHLQLITEENKVVKTENAKYELEK